MIDTSGSMSDELLADISAELGVMAKHFKVTVVECDAAIRAVYPYRPIKTVCGRGGTSFRPPLKAKFLRAQKPDLIVCFTDGSGPAPKKTPALPVLWCLTQDGEKPASWGEEIRMGEPKQVPEYRFSVQMDVFLVPAAPFPAV